MKKTLDPIVVTLVLAVALLFGNCLTGCTQQQRRVRGGSAPRAVQDYSRPLPPGASALRLISDPARLPDIGGAYRNVDARLLVAIERSLGWFEAPSSHRYFPIEGISHEHARASLVAMIELLESARSEGDFVAAVRRDFDVYESVGYDQRGTVLFTGYFAPILPASRVRSSRFRYPLYRRPADLVTDPVSGAPRGQLVADGRVVSYPARREIESSGMLAGTELVWLADALSVYLVHVNGSAKLRLPDSSVMYVGYGGKTDRKYASLGQAMVKSGMLATDGVSLTSIRRAYRREPRRVEELMNQNESYVFFTEMDEGIWPAGSLGVPVSGETSLATDKSIYPRGGLVLADTKAVTFSQGSRPFLRFMLDQDTGGAIRAPGRADIFMGVGPGAEILAGGQYAEGKLYYLFLKP